MIQNCPFSRVLRKQFTYYGGKRLCRKWKLLAGIKPKLRVNRWIYWSKKKVVKRYHYEKVNFRRGFIHHTLRQQTSIYNKLRYKWWNTFLLKIIIFSSLMCVMMMCRIIKSPLCLRRASSNKNFFLQKLTTWLSLFHFLILHILPNKFFLTYSLLFFCLSDNKKIYAYM
jgi:hypothetical protein